MSTNVAFSVGVDAGTEMSGPPRPEGSVRVVAG